MHSIPTPKCEKAHPEGEWESAGGGSTHQLLWSDPYVARVWYDGYYWGWKVNSQANGREPLAAGLAGINSSLLPEDWEAEAKGLACEAMNDLLAERATRIVAASGDGGAE
jgi:hypothetical protein